MREKSESTAKIKKIAEEVFARHGRYPVVLRSDNEPALNTRKLDDYLATKGGGRQNSEAYDARSNGLIERHIGTTFDGILTNLAGVGLPMEFWCFAAEAFVTESTKVLPGLTLSGRGKLGFRVLYWSRLLCASN